MGSKSPSVSVVQPPPPQVTQMPPPNVQQNASDLFKAQLEYNPQLTAQAVQLQQQYGPQLAQSEFNQTSAIAPQYRALLEQQYPQIPTLTQQVQERLLNPQGLTPQMQSAQDFSRQRASDDLSRNIRSQANLGGNLYSGNREDMETRAQAELQNQFAQSDIGLQDQRRAQSISELLSLLQVAGLPVQQTQAAPQYGQGVTPSADALMQAIQNSYIVNPAVVGFGPSSRELNYRLLGSAFGAAGQAAGGAGGAAAACHVAEVLYGVYDLRTWLARAYVATHDSIFLRAYRRWSKVWASWLLKLPMLKPVVKPLWDRMWHAQVEGR